MNIYALFPLIATIAYIPLLIITFSQRPWHRQQQLFILYLISAVSWSLADFLCRSNFFLENAMLMGRIVILMFGWMGVQFHCFTSSFFAPGQGRWLIFAYGSLLAMVVVIALGYIPKDMIISGEEIYPIYDKWLLVIIIPLLVLLARNMFVFTRRLKSLDNPTLNSQITSLVFALIVLGIFSLTAVLPWAKEFPISHFGNIINAFVLSYATVGQQLVDIRYVFRRVLAWLTLVIAGAIVYSFIVSVFHLFIDFSLSFTTLAIGLAAAIAAFTVVYYLRGISQKEIDRIFYAKTYDFRRRLSDFVGRIQNVFGLRELSSELLPLVVKATKCKRGAIFFPESGTGDFVAHLVEPPGLANPLSNLRIRRDNPIIRYMSRKHHVLSIQSLDIIPEFYSLWEEEREALKIAEIELFIPVVSRGKLISAIILSRKQSGRYLLEDINMLEDIAGKVAVSLERGYLHEEVRQRQEDLSLISHLATIMTSSLDVKEICDRFIKELRKSIDADGAAIIVTEDEMATILALSTEAESPWKVGERIPLKGSEVEWVTEHKEPLLQPNLAQESKFWTGENHLQSGMQTVLHLPLRVNDKPIGSLALTSRKPNAFSQSQVQLLSQLASQIAMPIENARLYAEAEQLARIDQLTGLWNRRHLEERIQIEIGRHSRYGGTFSLVMADLDGFKAFNDNFGHLAGDTLLKQLGDIMKTTIRGTDEAFRYGGDEFAILLSQTAVREGLDVAERVRTRIAEEFKVGEKLVSASIGLASWPTDGVRINEVIAAADMALYYSKQNGGNQCHAASELISPPTKKSARVNGETDRSAFNFICALAAAVDAKDHYAYKHSQNVREYAIMVAKKMAWSAEDASRLSTCALLHDIGKIGISDGILNKTSHLSVAEWDLMRTHPQIGANIVSHVPQLAPCLAGILYHHEYFDGSGYPAGLKGEAIPLDARILGVVDAYEAMTSTRPYRPAFSNEEALAELRRGSGKQFDPEVVKLFIAIKSAPTVATDQKA
jgi:diguanylate cyclase (GGDEF)-like protein